MKGNRSLPRIHERLTARSPLSLVQNCTNHRTGRSDRARVDPIVKGPKLTTWPSPEAVEALPAGDRGHRTSPIPA